MYCELSIIFIISDRSWTSHKAANRGKIPLVNVDEPPSICVYLFFYFKSSKTGVIDSLSKPLYPAFSAMRIFLIH
jgi:hypothetical protein